MDKKTEKKSKPKTKSTSVKPAIQAREQSAQKKPNFLRLTLTILGLLLWTSAVIIAVEYAVTFGLYALLGRETIMTPVWLTIINAIIYALSCFLIIWVPVKLFKKKKLSRKDLGLDGLITWSDIGLSIAGFAAYFIIAAFLVSIFSNFSFFNIDQTQELGYRLLSNGFDRMIAFLALCIIAPIVEELIFRGWLYAKLREKIPGKYLSLILSIFLVSLLFGILHGQWNVGVNVFAMSIVLCGLREITGTIYSGILLHIVKNIVAFVFVYILGFGN